MAKRNVELAVTTRPAAQRLRSGDAAPQANIDSDPAGSSRRALALVNEASNAGDAQLPLALWDAAQLAERLGVSPRFVRRLVEERRVPFLKVGKFIRFDPAEIGAWLEMQRVGAVSA